MKRRNFFALPAAVALINNLNDKGVDFGRIELPDEGSTIGFGYQFEHQGKLCRTAVLLPRNPTENDFIEAWDLLAKAVKNPTPETCVFGDNILSGHEQKVSSLS